MVLWYSHERSNDYGDSVVFFHILPISIAKSLYFSMFSSSFFHNSVSPGIATSMILHSSIILSIRIRSGLLVSIVLSVCTLKCHNSLTFSFSITGSALWSYHFSVWGRPYFLHRAQCIVVATLSCCFLYSVWSIFDHSLTIWLTVSSFSLHNLHVDSLVLFFIFAFL